MKTPAAVIAAAVIAVAALGVVLGVVLVAPQRENLGTLITIVITGAGTLITSIITLGRVEQTRSTTEDLANGRMDAKIRAGVADVMREKYLDPAAHAQLVEDRRSRDSSV